VSDKKLLEERWGKMRSARAKLETTTAKRVGFARSRKRSQKSRVKILEKNACKSVVGKDEVNCSVDREIHSMEHQPEIQGEEKVRKSWIRITRFNKGSSPGMMRRRTSAESREPVKMNLRE